MNGQRLMIYDRTCTRRWPIPGLTDVWRIGGRLYGARAKLDAWHGAATWAEAFDWLLRSANDEPIAEIQFWGHGQWGGLWMEEDLLTRACLVPGHGLYGRLDALRTRLVGDGRALWWFRSCDTFGTQAGHDFARAWTDFFACSAAGHTYHIGFWQSGLHRLRLGAQPDWSTEEGVLPGRTHAVESRPWAPNTITCLHTSVPS